jgi:hypothetical protein
MLLVTFYVGVTNIGRVLHSAGRKQQILLLKLAYSHGSHFGLMVSFCSGTFNVHVLAWHGAGLFASPYFR